MTHMTHAATFAAVFVTLYAGHQIGDHWVQTEHQAASKGGSGWSARLACARHVATYTATLTVLLVVAVWLLGLPFTWQGIAAGQLVSAVTHYWADRRFTLRRLAHACGHAPFYRLGAPRPGLSTVAVPGGPGWTAARVPHDNPSLGTGAYAMDQSWHYLWLWVSALVTVLVGAA